MISKDSLVNRNGRVISCPSEVLGRGRQRGSVVVAQAFPSWQLSLPNTSIANILERLRGPAQQALSRRPKAEPQTQQGPQPECEPDAPPATFQPLGGNTAVLLDPKNDRLIYLVAAEGDDDNTTTEVRLRTITLNTVKQP